MQFRFSALLGTLAVHGLMVAPVVVLAGGGQDDGPQLDKMVTIEASLAYKKKTASKQPQKQRSPKPPPPKVEGVSHDENKTPTDKPPEDEKPVEPTTDFEKEFEKYKNLRQDDQDEGDPIAPEGGAFDGSEHGFAETSRGDPFFQELAADVYGAWKLPSLERGSGDAQGCIRLATDGRIMDTKLFKKTDNANIDRSVSLALSDLKKLRDEDPKPVPVHLKDATTRWTCFTFPVPKAGE